MKQERIQIGKDECCPELGFPGWPIYEIKCPECNLFKKDYGEVQTKIDGHWHNLCIKCGEIVWADVLANETVTAGNCVNQNEAI